MYSNQTYRLIFFALACNLLTLPSHAANFFPETVAELKNAINAANSNNQNDVIDLINAPRPLVFTAVDNDENALPIITNDSAGYSVTIKNGSFYRELNSLPLFRFLYVNLNSYLILENMVLEGGHVPGSGGAVFSDGNLEVSYSTMRNNRAEFSGGAILTTGVATDLAVTNSAFIGNYSSDGGAISNFGFASLIANNTFDQNRCNAGSGGGIRNTGTTINFFNNTVTRNIVEDGEGPVSGGGISNDGLIVNFVSNIVAENSANDNPDLTNSGTINSASYNIIGIDEPGDNGFHDIINGENNNIVGTTADPIDPQLAELNNQGGPTLIRAVLPTSPALNQGANPGLFDYDQRGEFFFREIGPTDIGAYECQTIDCIEHFEVSTPAEINDAIEYANTSGLPVDINLGGGTFIFSASIQLNDDLMINNFDLRINVVPPLTPVRGTITIQGGTIVRTNPTTPIPSTGKLGTLIRVTPPPPNPNEPPTTVQKRPSVTVVNTTVVNVPAGRRPVPLDMLTGDIDAMRASQVNESGAAIYNDGIVEIINSSFTDFEAIRDGGAVYNTANAESLTIINSTFNNNSAGRHGGAVASNGPIPIIINSTFSSNVAIEKGGALYSTQAANTIDNNTFYLNSASLGGGIFNLGTIDNLVSNIIAKNSADSDHDLANAGIINNNSHNLIARDPLLLPLADNGGPTQTHALTSASPAINKGANPNEEEFDQRGEGYARSVGGNTDIGAFECQSNCGDTRPSSGSGGMISDAFLWPTRGPSIAATPVEEEPIVAPVIPTPPSTNEPVKTAVKVDTKIDDDESSSSSTASTDSAQGCSTTAGASPLLQLCIIWFAMMLRKKRAHANL